MDPLVAFVLLLLTIVAGYMCVAAAYAEGLRRGRREGERAAYHEVHNKGADAALAHYQRMGGQLFKEPRVPPGFLEDDHA